MVLSVLRCSVPNRSLLASILITITFACCYEQMALERCRGARVFVLSWHGTFEWHSSEREKKVKLGSSLVPNEARRNPIHVLPSWFQVLLTRLLQIWSWIIELEKKSQSRIICRNMNVDCNILGNGGTISVLACAPRANRMHRRWYKQLQWSRIHLRSFVPTQLKFQDVVKYWWSGNILKQTIDHPSIDEVISFALTNRKDARNPATCCFDSRKQAMGVSFAPRVSGRAQDRSTDSGGKKGLKSQSSAAPTVLPIDFDWTAFLQVWLTSK